MKNAYPKYHNQKTEIDGITFDSKLEANRYSELKILERAGTISGLQLQPEFELIPPFTKNGKKYRGMNYVADFTYYDNQEKRVVVEDTKGFETDVYKLKKKMFEYMYPTLTITEIKR